MVGNKSNFTGNKYKANLAKKVKEIRKEKGLSQKKLSDKLGVSRNIVTSWETEVCMPEVENLVAIADLAEISLDELVGRVNQPKKECLSEETYVNMLEELGEKVQELIQFEKKRVQGNAQ